MMLCQLIDQLTNLIVAGSLWSVWGLLHHCNDWHGPVGVISVTAAVATRARRSAAAIAIH